MFEDRPTDDFWKIADQFLKRDQVSKGSLMGFPCLRSQGEFFATADHRSGNLIVKLPAQRVQQLINKGSGVAFAPAGKTFREWIQIEQRNPQIWKTLMNEAKDFVDTRKKNCPTERFKKS